MTSTLNPETISSSDNKDEFKDLGFGTEVARGTRRRLLNRDGSFNVVLEGLNPLSSLGLYQWLLSISWPHFLGFITASYIATNGLRAFPYLVCGLDAPHATTAGPLPNEPLHSPDSS